MYNDIFNNMKSAQDSNDFDLLFNLISEFVRDFDINDLPDELQEAYYSRFDKEPIDKSLLEELKSRIHTNRSNVFHSAKPSIADCIRYGIENRPTSKIDNLSQGSIDTLLHCSIEIEKGFTSLDSLSNFLGKQNVRLEEDQLTALSEFVRWVYPRLARSSSRQKTDFRAARSHKPED